MMFLEMLSILIIKQGTYICLFLKNWITLLKLSAFKHMTSSIRWGERRHDVTKTNQKSS